MESFDGKRKKKAVGCGRIRTCEDCAHPVELETTSLDHSDTHPLVPKLVFRPANERMVLVVFPSVDLWLRF